MAELGIFAGKNNVAMSGKFGRARQAVAMYLGDNGFGQ